MERAPSAARPRPHAPGIGLTISIIAFILAVPALYRPTLSGKLPFDGSILAQLNAIRPRYVFIGNSMLETRIDPHVLEERLGPDCCFLVSTKGAESAWDHQVLKNAVLAANSKPKTVFMFFRDVSLTRVTFRTNDAYGWRIERMSHENDREIAQAMQESRTWREKLEYEFGNLYPIQKRRENADYVLEWLASRAAFRTKIAFGAPVTGQFNELFGLDKLKNVAAADDAGTEMDDPSLYDFDAKIKTSLLPSMIHLASSAGVYLTFVRVQRRPTAHGPPPQPAELREYIEKLKSYLSANRMGYYDFTGDPELTLDHYNDGDHIRSDWRAASTELFLKRLAGYLQ